MLHAFEKLAAYLKLFPALLSGIIALDKELAVGGIGGAKLELLLAFVQAAYDAEESIRKAVPWAQVVNTISVAAGKMVAILKKVGILKSQDPAPAAAPAK